MTMGGIGNNSGIQFQQNIAMINSLKKSLNLAVQQNSKLKSRLKKIYLDADISDIQEVSDKSFAKKKDMSLDYKHAQ